MHGDANIAEVTFNNDGSKSSSHFLSIDVAEGVMLTALLVLSLLGNGLVCYCGITSTRTQAMNHFIVNLAFAEMLLAALVLPLNIQKQLTGSFPAINPNICRLLEYFQTVCLGVINITLTLVAFDRYISIFLPQSKITLRKAKYMIVFSWCLPLLIASPIFLDLSGSSGRLTQLFFCCREFRLVTTHKLSKIHALVQIAIVSVVPMCILSGTYFVMVLRILRIDASRRNLKRSQAPCNKRSPCGTFREEVPVAKRRALVMNFIVSSLFLFCWTPFVTLYTMQAIRGHVKRSENSLYDLLSYIALANLSFNPLVYCFFDSVFRNHVLCCLRQRQSLRQAGKLSQTSKPLTEEKLGELNVSKINSAKPSSACSDQEPLLRKSTVQPKARSTFFSRDKLIRLVCNTRRYRSLGLSHCSEI